MHTSTGERAWHAVLAVVGAAALVAQTGLVVAAGSSVVDLLAYFTIQSNVLVLVAAVNVALGRPWQGTSWRLVRLAGLVGITVTGVVYVVAIGPSVSFEGLAWWTDTAFHHLVPALAVAGHVLFTPRDTFGRRDLAFVAWPVAWLGLTLARGAWGSPDFAAAGGTRSRYPYDFLDVDAHGTASVALACVVVTVLLLGVALAFERLGAGRGGTPA